jgi:hypothetical protein
MKAGCFPPSDIRITISDYLKRIFFDPDDGNFMMHIILKNLSERYSVGGKYGREQPGGRKNNENSVFYLFGKLIVYGFRNNEEKIRSLLAMIRCRELFLQKYKNFRLHPRRKDRLNQANSSSRRDQCLLEMQIMKEGKVS